MSEQLLDRLFKCNVYEGKEFISSLKKFKKFSTEEIQDYLLDELNIHSSPQHIEELFIETEKEYIQSRPIKKFKNIQHDDSDNIFVCPKCSKKKKEGEYKRFQCICIDCKKEICKNYYNKNSKKIKQYHDSPRFAMLSTRSQAKQRNIPFLVGAQWYYDNIIGKPCLYCGGETRGWADRLINDHSLGYTEENTVPCCEMCNKMKSHQDKDKFIKHCKRVAEFNK